MHIYIHIYKYIYIYINIYIYIYIYISAYQYRLFNKAARLKRLHHKRFPRIFVKFSRKPYNETSYTTKIANG